jgi:hypothetical protein
MGFIPLVERLKRKLYKLKKLAVAVLEIETNYLRKYNGTNNNN